MPGGHGWRRKRASERSSSYQYRSAPAAPLANGPLPPNDRMLEHQDDVEATLLKRLSVHSTHSPAQSTGRIYFAPTPSTTSATRNHNNIGNQEQPVEKASESAPIHCQKPRATKSNDMGVDAFMKSTYSL